MGPRRVLLALSIAVLVPLSLPAQDLRDLLTGFLRDGVTLRRPSLTPNPCDQPPPVPATCHVAHFNSVTSQIEAINQFNLDLQSQLSSFPLPSSSGGFTYRYDASQGTFVRAADSFGPIYAERAETIGKGFMNFGVNFSHFTYDRIDDLKLKADEDRLLFLHAAPGSANPLTNNNPLNPWFRGDVVTGPLSVKVDTGITAFVATYGLTDRLDIGVAVPVVNVSLREQSTLKIERLATGDDRPELHRFAGGAADCQGTEDVETCQRSGSATGLGDVLIRGKFRLTSSPRGGIALATDVRLPTGREKDLLGTGSTQIRAFLVASAHLGAFSPHLNAGYTWATNRTGLSDEINYTAGFDWALGSRVTFAGDVIGRTFRNARTVRLQQQKFCVNTAESFAPPPDTPCNSDPRLITVQRTRLDVSRSDLNTLIGSAGFKANVVGNLLLTVNGLFSITKKGLQDTFTPVVGFDYAF